MFVLRLDQMRHSLPRCLLCSASNLRVIAHICSIARFPNTVVFSVMDADTFLLDIES